MPQEWYHSSGGLPAWYQYTDLKRFRLGVLVFCLMETLEKYVLDSLCLVVSLAMDLLQFAYQTNFDAENHHFFIVLQLTWKSPATLREPDHLTIRFKFFRAMDCEYGSQNCSVGIPQDTVLALSLHPLRYFEKVNPYTFLGVHLDNKQYFTITTDVLYWEAPNKLYLLGRLKTFMLLFLICPVQQLKVSCVGYILLLQ